MDITFFESLLYAVIAGITQFMPISPIAHDEILAKLFGLGKIHPFMQLFIHTGVLVALIISCKPTIRHIYRENNLRKIAARRRKRQPDPQVIGDFFFLNTAALPIVVGSLFYISVYNWNNRLLITAGLLILNGLILHIPSYFSTGNKDSRSMTRLDALVFGLVSALGILPGLSSIALSGSYASLRGADFSQTYKWCLLLCVPVLVMLIIFDLILIFSSSFVGFSFLFFLQCLIGAVVSGAIAVFTIRLLRMFVDKNGMSVFSYYCWGAGLFAFILFLYT